MSITLYTAPDCQRCKIVKAFLKERGIAYGVIDFKADAQEFNTFYRANRKHIYRNPEGVEFPLFHDGEVIKQGSGEIIAYLLAGRALEVAVTRSELLHGWISGLYVSRCPAEQEDNFVTLAEHLAAGGLSVLLRTDGRNPALLRRLVAAKTAARLSLDIPGPAAVYHALYGQAPDRAALAETIEIVRAFPDHEIRFFATPVPRADGAVSWPTRDEAGEAANLVFEACGDHQLPYRIACATAETPGGLQGLAPLEDAVLLKYRSASRSTLFKADIAPR
ncbi:glutaredoxin family protein [Solidesulfovibrio sp. C21]|uniref:glutaredoxin family protein n=1 Tax=Solidesulfovibrio sp. C21 TaxID=3398613 RepID=UPI0039FD0DF4